MTPELRVVIHVTRARCDFPGCGVASFHVHWRGRTFASAFDGSLTRAELDEFDDDCRADNRDRAAWRSERTR